MIGGSSLFLKKVIAAWNRSGRRPVSFFLNSTQTLLAIFRQVFAYILTEIYTRNVIRLTVWNYRGKRPSKNGVVGITVSTNYHQLLKHCIAANLEKLDHWIVVTNKTDHQTIKILEKNSKIDVLFWDPNRKGRVFDKGGGLRLGQQFAYRRYPGRWYLILDSDICLPQEFTFAPSLLEELDIRLIHGALRRDFASKKDFLERKNFQNYNALGNAGFGTGKAIGYFQLYALPLLYHHSKTAGACDIRFRDRFLKASLIQNLVVDHLGHPGNWDGRGVKDGGWKE